MATFEDLEILKFKDVFAAGFDMDGVGKPDPTADA